MAATQYQRGNFHQEVAERLGLLPNFFCSAAAAPELISRLWDFARSGYFDNPLPSLFKERLFVYVSRFCPVRYCVIRHVGFLVGAGFPAGDADCPPQTVEQVVALLKRPVPGEAELDAALARLESAGSSAQIPPAETQREYDLFDALTLLMLEPRRSARARRAVGKAFGEAALEYLTAFLAFIRTAHFWTETHPEIEIEPDVTALMGEHEELAQLLRASPESLGTWPLTERASAEAALRNTEEQGYRRLASIVESSDDAIISKDLNGTVTSWNRGAECLFGYVTDEVVGKPVMILIPQDRDDEEEGILECIRRGKRVDHYETVRRHKDGSLLDVSLTVSPVQDPQGRIVGASEIARDITPRKRAEEALRLSEAAAKQATQARDDILGTVAHDLRNPLATIATLAEVLRANGAATEIGDEIADAANRMNRLIGDLLDVARIEAGHLSLKQERLPAAEIIAAALERQKPLASSASLELRHETASDLPDICADRDRLLQVFDNLIGNAIKFIEPGGRITVSAAPRTGEVLFSVSDTGRGIAPSHVPHVFDRFWQAPGAERRGAGFGLAIVKGLVEAHHGRVWVQSSTGQGSTFFFTIPSAAAQT